MATHKQIDQNVNDTLDAWGRLQQFVSQLLPTLAATTDGMRTLLNQRRRF